ncbi:MAG: glycosyltransferase family 2 protein, partial [Methanobrevibacter sp.]
NVNVRFLSDLMDSYIYARQCTERFSKDIQTISVNPHLIYWMHTWKNSPFTKSENKLLLSKVEKLKRIHKSDLKTKMLLSSMTTAIESAIKIHKE